MIAQQTNETLNPRIEAGLPFVEALARLELLLDDLLSRRRALLPRGAVS